MKLLKNIKNTSVGKDAIIIATDVDLSGEGDVLAWEIINFIGWRGPVYRLRFKAETKPAVLDAFKKLTNARAGKDWAIYQGGLARQYFDYISQEYSPYATINVRQQGYKLDALRIGRLKSVINMVVWYQQYLRKNYVKKPFYEVRFKDREGNMFKREYNDGDSFRFEDKMQGENDLANYHASNIQITSTETKTQQPPSLLSLSDLNVLVSKDGISDKAFNETYEAMYTQGYVSYPRTEDTKITQDDFNELLPHVDEIADVIGINKILLTHRELRSKHKIKQEDHGANRPGTKVPVSLDEIRNKFGNAGVSIYIHLAKSYLSILCEDYVYEQDKANLVEYPTFTATLNKPVEMNYKLVFNDSELEDDENCDQSKNFGDLANPILYEGSNTKPAKPTKSFINNFLKKHNLGTGATRTNALEVLGEGNKSTMKLTKKDGYVLNYNGTLSALATQHTMIASVKMTYKLQELLKTVREGKLDWRKVPPLMPKFFEKDMPIQKNMTILKNDPDLQKLAEKANPTYEKKEKVKGTWQGKEVSISKEFGGHTFTEEELTKLFADQEIEFNAVSSKTGKSYTAKGKIYNLVNEIIENGRKKKIKYVGFALTPKEVKADDDHFVGIWRKKKVRVAKKWSTHVFTPKEQEVLLAGKEIEFNAVSSKTGKSYTAKGKLGTKTLQGKKIITFKPNFK